MTNNTIILFQFITFQLYFSKRALFAEARLACLFRRVPVALERNAN